MRRATPPGLSAVFISAASIWSFHEKHGKKPTLLVENRTVFRPYSGQAVHVCASPMSKRVMKVGLAGVLATLAFSGHALAAQYFVYAGSYTAEPSSGTAPALPAGRAAPPPSTSKGIYGWRFDTITRAVLPLGLVAETANPAQISVSPNGKF